MDQIKLKKEISYTHNGELLTISEVKFEKIKIENYKVSNKISGLLAEAMAQAVKFSSNQPEQQSTEQQAQWQELLTQSISLFGEEFMNKILEVFQNNDLIIFKHTKLDENINAFKNLSVFTGGIKDVYYLIGGYLDQNFTI